jgi:hypothetical protein
LLGKANPLLDARSKEETPRLQELSDELAHLRFEEALAARQHELAAEAGESRAEDPDEAGAERRRAIERVEGLLRAELELLLAPDQPRVR